MKKDSNPEHFSDVSDVETNPKTGDNFFKLNLHLENLQEIINAIN